MSGLGRPWRYEPAGRFDEHVFSSSALEGNPLGDPHERPLWVYLPPGYDDEPERRYPSIYVIQGYTGQLDMWRNRPAFAAQTYPELCDDVFRSGDVPPAIVVWVGRVDEARRLAVPRLARDRALPHLPLRRARPLGRRALPHAARGGAPRHPGEVVAAATGRWSTPMLRPDLFGGFATHAGDALFEACYAKDFPETARLLRDKYDGSYEKFWDDFLARPLVTKPGDFVLVNSWGMAAAYSADDDGTVQLPFDDTGKLIPEVWERWLAWDPVRMVEGAAEALRAMRAIYVDAGKSDEYYLDLGAEAFRRELERVGVTDVFFELFEGKHGGIVWRYPIALRYLAERLA